MNRAPTPSHQAASRHTQFQLYQLHKIPEYWIVDPADRSVEQNKLGDTATYAATHCHEQVEFAATGAVVDLGLVWK